MSSLTAKTLFQALCSCRCVRRKPKTVAEAATGLPMAHAAGQDVMLCTPERYTCDICGQEGLTEDDMRCHVLIEHIEGAVSCPFCDLEGTTAEEMNLHVNMDHLDFLGHTEQHSKAACEDLTPSSGRTSGLSPSALTGTSPASLRSSAVSNGPSVAADGLDVPDAAMPPDPSTQSPPEPDNSSTHSSEASTCPMSPVDIAINIVSPQQSPKKTSVQPETPVDDQQNCKRAKLYLDVPRLSQPRPADCSLANQENNNVCLPPICPATPSPSPPGLDCPLCDWHTTSPREIARHVNTRHRDVLSPQKPQIEADAANNNVGLVAESPSVSQFECPLCNVYTSTAAELEHHVHRDHADDLSPGKVSPMSMGSVSGSSGSGCPVCGMAFSDTNELLTHVEGHFSGEQTPVLEHADSQFALELEQQEREALQHQEEKQFQQLQEMYGMSNASSYKKQAERSLEQAVCRGEMSLTDFYAQKQQVLEASTASVDDGHTCTKGVIPRLQAYYKFLGSSPVAQHWLSPHCEHYSASIGDKGWGCGYRNLQMLLSSLAHNTTYQQVLFNGRPLIPSISKIQRLIEAAWQKGFDLQGSEQLGGALVNTTKWIGATEILAMLSSLGIKCQLIDFHGPTKDGFHPVLFEWVRDYFKKDSEYKPPLYLQHQGHSRTIVGVEELKDGSLRLLIFDPSCSRKQMRQFLGDINANLMRCLRRSPNSLKAKQYQIVAVIGVLSEQEYEESKILKSDRIP